MGAACGDFARSRRPSTPPTAFHHRYASTTQDQSYLDHPGLDPGRHSRPFHHIFAQRSLKRGSGDRCRPPERTPRTRIAWRGVWPSWGAVGGPGAGGSGLAPAPPKKVRGKKEGGEGARVFAGARAGERVFPPSLNACALGPSPFSLSLSL